LKKLPTSSLPEELSLHLPLDDDERGRIEVEDALPAILFTDIFYSRSKVGFAINVETKEWLDLLFETLVVADLVKPPDYDWDSRFEFVECPEPKEYMAEIIRLAKASGFSVESSEPEWWADLFLANYPKLRSIYGSIVETMKPINDALLDFLCRRIVLNDFVLETELPLHPRIKQNRER